MRCDYTRREDLYSHMKKYFITGLIILLPFALTIIVAIWLFDFLTEPFAGMVEHLIVSFEQQHGIDVKNHAVSVIILSRVIVVVFMVALTFLLGILGRKFFFNTILHFSQKLFARIPIIKTIYTISHDVTKSLLREGKSTFDKTVLIPFPRPETHALGLVTGELPLALKNAISDKIDLAVFVPTSPHPISGYILLASKKELVDVEMTTEEVFRYLISCGLAQTETTGKSPSVSP